MISTIRHKFLQSLLRSSSLVLHKGERLKISDFWCLCTKEQQTWMTVKAIRWSMKLVLFSCTTRTSSVRIRNKSTPTGVYILPSLLFIKGFFISAQKIIVYHFCKIIEVRGLVTRLVLFGRCSKRNLYDNYTYTRPTPRYLYHEDHIHINDCRLSNKHPWVDP